MNVLKIGKRRVGSVELSQTKSSKRSGLRGALPFDLAFKEVWRNKSRFAAITVVVALITLLVLFTAGLAEGLGLGNREFIENVNADLVVYNDTAQITIPSSRLNESKVRDLRLVDGVEDAGAVAATSVQVVLADGRTPTRVALLGVLVGKPGEPPVIAGQQLEFRRAMEALIDESLVARTGLRKGDKLTLRSVEGDKEKDYVLDIVGITRSNQYSIQPSVFVPHLTWEKIRPRSQVVTDLTPNQPNVNFNVAFVRLGNPADASAMMKVIQRNVSDVQAVNKQTAWENTPGYSAQQSTLTLQRVFTLLIGLLVVGSFFRVQALQKIAQVGVLKAIGTPNRTIVFAALSQIFFVNAAGVAFGTALTLALIAFIPPVVPIRLDGVSVIATIVLMLIVGPLGALESVRFLLRAEPLKALGLAS